MNLKTYTLALACAALLASCSSSKTQLPYFTDLTEIEGTLPIQDYNPEIKPDDELFITITSPSVPQSTEEYNMPLNTPATRESIQSKMVQTPSQQTYVVDSKGDIYLPTLGEMHVAGLTTEQVRDEIAAQVRKSVSDAMVRVELVNFQVVVAGEVATPRTIPVTRNRFSVLDAISQAGDLTPYGERSNVLIIREENGKRVYKRLNLNSSDVLTSPYFYLQQNDYVYVEPNDIRKANSKYNQNNAYKLTVISTIVSAASVVASLVIALTVK